MRIIFWILGLSLAFTTTAQAQKIKNKEDMKTKKTLRLIYPQWQGGGSIDEFVPELPAEDAFKGYYLGAQLLELLAPESTQQKIVVPITLDIKDREEANGVLSYHAIYRQTKDALALVEKNDPDKIVTLGGECSVSVVPFTYLANKYKDDVAVIWIDAHPDISLPYEGHRGYHAMALSSCMGAGDKNITDLLPAQIDASKVLLVGLRSWDDDMQDRQQQLGIQHLTPEEVANNSDQIKSWLKSTGASKVLIHFDLDVIDPKEMIAAVGTDPDGMKINEVVRVINDISQTSDLVGLTIAEPMPRVAILIRNMLNELPLLKD